MHACRGRENMILEGAGVPSQVRVIYVHGESGWTCSSGRAGNTDLPLDREALVTAPTGHGVASNLASITPARLWTRYNSREVVSIALVETKCMRHSLFRYPPTVEWNFSSNPASAITRDAAMPFPYLLIDLPSLPIACGRVLTSPMAKGRGLPE